MTSDCFATCFIFVINASGRLKRKFSHFSLGFMYAELGGRSVVSLGVGVLGCGDTPVQCRLVR